MTSSCNNRWIFDETQLINTPSRLDNIGQNEELLLRQKGTDLIRQISEILKLKLICTNTAIVYFHRFFMFRSIKRFDVNQIAVSSLFLAAKFEEQPIFKDHIIKVSFICQNKTQPIKDEDYKKECDKLIENENEMLLTLGFDLSVRHPHSVIINASQISVINKTICQKAYLLANDLLRLTTLCLQYSPQFIACVCIHISSHLLNIPITVTNDKNDWCQLVDANIRLEAVERVTQKYKHLISPVVKHPFDQQKKRTQSFDDNCSPESAYSSGSGNSPVYDNPTDQKSISLNPTSGSLNDRHSNKNSCYKRFRSDQSYPSSHSTAKPKSMPSKNSSINTISNSYSKIALTNPNLVPNDANAVRNSGSGTNLPPNDLTIAKTGLTSKVRKLITYDDDLYKCKTNAIKTSNLPKTADNIFSSSTESLKTTNNIKFGKKCLMNPKNFTITFSNDSFKDKANDTSKTANSVRIVRESGNNSKQIVRIES